MQNAVAAGMAGATPIGEGMLGSIDAFGKGIDGALKAAAKTVADLGISVGGVVEGAGKTIGDVAGFSTIKFPRGTKRFLGCGPINNRRERRVGRSSIRQPYAEY